MNPTAIDTMPEAERRRRIKEIRPETRLHEVLEQVLLALGYDWVEIGQGTQEFGKDVVAYGRTLTGGEEYVGIVAKLGDISGAAAGRSTLGVVQRQVDQAFSIGFDSVRAKSHIRITRVMVVCTGKISQNAKTEIVGKTEQFRNVEFWDCHRLEQMITKKYPEFYVGMEPRAYIYLIRFLDKHSDLSDDYKRFGATSDRGLPEVFVEPRMMMMSDDGPQRQKLGTTRLAAEADGNNPTFNSAYLQAPKKSLMLMGAPGSGKTIALRHAAIKLAERRLAGDQTAPFPTFVSATKLLACMDQGCAEALYLSMPLCEALTSEQLHNQLSHSDSVLFLDGLDEVGTQAGIDKVGGFVEELKGLYPRMRVICSSRITRFKKPDGMKHLQQAMVLPMNVPMMAKLIIRILGRGRRSMDVLHSFFESGLQLTLPRTPLVVTLLALLHQQEEMGEIPANLADLYDMFFQAYLGRWSQGTEGRNPLDEYKIRAAVLEHFAAKMHEARAQNLLWDDAIHICGEYLELRSLDTTPEECLQGILDAGVMTAREHGDSGKELLRFAHLSFQEYFAACRLVSAHGDTDAVSKLYHDPWWGSVVAFYAGIRRDVPDLVERLVALPPPEDPFAVLGAAMQLGNILQAGTLTPTPAKRAGCLRGSDFFQLFYSQYAALQKEGQAPIKLSRVQLLFTIGILYGASYGSGYLAEANDKAVTTLLDEMIESDGDERFLFGVRAFCTAAALAHRGDWSGMDKFIAAASMVDFPILQAAATMIEEFEPMEIGDSEGDERERRMQERTRWKKVVRGIRKFAPKKGAETLRRLSERPKPMETGGRLLDGGEEAPQTNLESDTASTAPN